MARFLRVFPFAINLTTATAKLRPKICFLSTSILEAAESPASQAKITLRKDFNINSAGNFYIRNPDERTRYIYMNCDGSRFAMKNDGAREFTPPRGPTLRKELGWTKYKLLSLKPLSKQVKSTSLC